jgi:hypothetical protein
MATSLADCIAKAGDAMRVVDEKEILQRVAELKASGFDTETAERKAVEEQMAAAQAQLQLLDPALRPETAPDQPASPSMQIAAEVRQVLETRAMDWRELFEIADRAFGGTQADGAYTPKDAYDALEAGVNQYILSKPTLFSPNVDADQAMLTVKALQDLVSRLPTQTKRTAEQDEFQQYSTIPPFAYVAAWVSGVKLGDLSLEPSAGIGGLSVFARVAGSNLVLNELSSRRAAVLRDVFPDVRVFQENAEQIDNILPDNIRPTVVLMNPPFSASAGRGVKSTALGARHVEQAFDRLEDGGRLVAIVGEGMAMDKPAFREWWAKMKTKGDIRAVIPMDGSGYAKYGTTFDNVLIVIDKVKPSGRPVVTTPAKDYTELIGLLADIRNDRPSTSAALVDPGAATQPDPDRGGSVAPAEGRGGNRLPGDAPAGAGGTAGVGTGEQPGGPAVATGGGKRGGSGRGAGSGRAGAEPGNGTGAGTGEDAAGGRDGGTAAGAGSAASGLKVESQQVAAGELTDSVYEVYTPQKLKIADSQPHPGPLVQSSAMSSVEPPDPTYTPNLPAQTVKTGLLSIAQLESVVYAGQSHAQQLEVVVTEEDAREYGLKQGTKYRRGFFVGDGTGVGKGREIGGIILDNLRQGRKKHVWISEKQGLMNDAKRDFGGVGGEPALVFNQNKTKVADQIKTADGVLFTTYSTLRGEEKKSDTSDKDKKARTRLDQLVDWLGKDFDGVIAFDEAHNAGNAVPMKGDRGWSNPSAQALAVVNLQKRLPNARVVYVSATGATEVSNLSFATRLGLWGTGTPFESVLKFIDQMTAGGLATMELVARDMKQMGAYIARSLSFDGVTYSRAEHELSGLQRDQYDKMAEAWQVVLRNMMTALQLTGAISDTGKVKNSKALANAKSALWGSHQRFFNQIITSMQMPTVLDAVDRDLEAGRSVLLQLVNTNEAQQERALAKKREEDEEDLEDLDLTPRDQLLQMVEKAFPVQQMEDFIDDNGKKQTRPVMDSEGRPVENKAAVKLRDKLLQDLKDIRVPDGPLEILLNHFGPEIVAEVTGRKQRVVRKPDDNGVVKAQIEKRGAAAARADADAFMADKKKILIFSDAGGTGFSFHADKTKKNQRKRSHYLIQPGWRANKAVQGFGRSHRTNQASAPHYVLASTDIPAHKRFLSSIARRLDQLGALTKGERKTGGGMFSEKDNLESKYAGQAVRQLFEDAQSGGVKGLSFQDFMMQMGLEDIVNPDNGKIAEDKMPDVRKFLNRLLSLKLDTQQVVFDAFIERMEEKIDTAAQRGELDTGMQTIRALETKVVSEEVVYTDDRTGASTSYVQLELTQPTTIYPFPEDKGSKAAPITWLVNNRSGRVWARVKTGNMTTKQGAIVDRFRMYGTGGIVTKTEEEFRVKGVYSEIGEGPAREMWAKETAAKPKTYTEQAHMIVGALLPIWDRLDTGKPMQVARTQTADNRRILGRLIAEADVAEIRKRLNVAAPEAKLPPEQVIARVLKGETGELANGWKLMRARVSDDLRVELKLDRPASRALELEFKQAGIITERIGWVDRYFIPLANPKALADVLKNRPLVGLSKPSEDGKFSRGGADAAGLPMADAKAVADAIRAANPGAPPIYVHERVSNAPEAVRDFIRKAGAELDVEAVYEDGEIHVFPENITSVERMAFVVGRHELRHHGLRGMLGGRMNPLLLSLWGKNAKLKQRAQEKIDQGLAQSRVEAVEEALADMPVDEIEALTGIDRLVAAVRQWLRDMAARLRASGFQKLADAIGPKTWTDADVAALVHRAEAVSKKPGGGMAPGTGAGPVFQRVFHGTAYRGIEKFSTDKIGTGEGAQAFGYGLYFASKRDIADMYREQVTKQRMAENPEFAAASTELRSAYEDVDMLGFDTLKEAREGLKEAADNYDLSPDERARIDRAEDAYKAAYKKFRVGQLYEVEIPEDSDMLLWDKQLSEQSEAVKGALRAIAEGMPGRWETGASGERRFVEPGRKITLALRNAESATGEQLYKMLSQGNDKAASEALMSAGVKGIKYLDGNSRGAGDGTFNYVVFSGDDVAIQRAMFSRAPGLRDRLRNAGGGPKIVGDTRRYTDEQRAAMRNIGAEVVAPTLEERARELWKDAGKKLAQGIADQFAPVKDISMEAYGLLRLAKGASGAFETMLNGGRLKLTDNVYDFDETARGGVIERLLVPLAGEHHDFFRWIAAKRAEQLKSQGRERLFTDADIEALKTLADGTTEFDYTIQHGAKAGTVTRDRTLIYADSLITFNEFNKNVMDMAEQSGLIDGESRSLWESEFYVPFYRVSDDENGGVQGMNIKSGVVRQQAFKKLKGGEQKLNADLLDNTLMNWAHLLDAAAKNRAARATLEAAENMGSAISAPESTARDMAAQMGKKSNVVWYMDRGMQRYYVVEDPMLLSAITSLQFAGMQGWAMKALGSFKHALTVGVTVSPFFKIRNLIRDSVQAIASAPLGPNPFANVAEGWKASSPNSDQYFRMMAGGGSIHFGSMMEGSEAKRVQKLVEIGVDKANILDSDAKMKAFWKNIASRGWNAYNELGNRGEDVNRAALYKQLRSQGVSHAEASLMARDLMDFSMQGTWTSIRFLSQTVPFFNARVQGLYKLGRAAKEDPARFSAVIGAAALMSIGLVLMFGDDPDWQKREEWDRNNYWWFKFGGMAFRIPKPFEIGAMATLAERSWELAFDKQMTGERFRKQVLTLLSDNLSMNPVPQLVKPMLDVYANKDFMGRPIERQGMENLAPELRYTSETSMAARALSGGMNAVTGVVGAKTLSPVQVDHLVRGYFGWLGSFVVQVGDVLARPATGQPVRPESDLFRAATGGMVADLRDAPSRYVSAMYEQAKEIEMAYGTWKELVRQGRQEEAAEYRADNMGLLGKYKSIERVKRAQGELNKQIKTVEQSEQLSAGEKRARLRELFARREAIAKPLVMEP